MRVIVAGGTGFIGRHLCEVLARRGDTVVVLTRGESVATEELPANLTAVRWDPAQPAGLEATLEGADAVINLCGAPIAAKRWSGARKKELEQSRVEPTRALVEAMGRCQKKPGVFVSSSAIGYYGNQGDTELVEEALPGTDFLAHLAIQWEDAAKPAEALGIRLVLLRIGVVLAAHGGAMAEMLPPFNAFVGGPLGPGTQWFPWVHMKDVSGMIVYALGNIGVRGPVNCTAPQPVRNEDFSRALARWMGRPCLFRVPVAALRLLWGESADLLLGSTRVLPKAAIDRGYFFRFAWVDDALKDIVGNFRSSCPNPWWPNKRKTVSQGKRIDECAQTGS